MAQSCLTLYDFMDGGWPGSSVHVILQATHWNGLPFPFPGNCSNLGSNPGSYMLQTDSLPSEPPGKPKITLQL